MIKEELIEFYCPEYSNIVNILKEYSDYELGLLEIFPDNINELEECIVKGIQWEILDFLICPFIDDFDTFFSEYGDELAEYSNEADIINYNFEMRAYTISKDIIIGMLNELLEDTKYSINEDVDFNEVIVNLNNIYPIKFCEK